MRQARLYAFYHKPDACGPIAFQPQDFDVFGKQKQESAKLFEELVKVVK